MFITVIKTYTPVPNAANERKICVYILSGADMTCCKITLPFIWLCNNFLEEM